MVLNHRIQPEAAELSVNMIYSKQADCLSGNILPHITVRLLMTSMCADSHQVVKVETGFLFFYSTRVSKKETSRAVWRMFSVLHVCCSRKSDMSCPVRGDRL